MKITEIREIPVGLIANIQNAVVSFDEHDVSLVAVFTDQKSDGRPVIGLGFNSIGRFAQGGLMRERFIPRLMAAEPYALLDEATGLFDPVAASAVMMRNEKPGGHGCRAGAVAALELALWDANAKIREVPACDLIAQAFDVSIANRSVPVYAAGGYYYPEDSEDRLRDEMKAYADSGYGYFKMKIGGAELRSDLRRIESAIRGAGEASRLAVDANGRFDLDQALAYGREMSDFGLRWYEEAGDPLDYALNSKLAEEYPNAVATGENLFSRRDVENLVRFGGMRPSLDYFQMDPGLSYGLTEFAGMIDTLEAHNFSRKQVHPHGGHVIGLHIAIGLGLGGCEAYPGVFEPFGGYPNACSVGDGTVTPTDAAGFGIEEKSELRPHLEKLLS